MTDGLPMIHLITSGTPQAQSDPILPGAVAARRRPITPFLFIVFVGAKAVAKELS